RRDARGVAALVRAPPRAGRRARPAGAVDGDDAGLRDRGRGGRDLHSRRIGPVRGLRQLIAESGRRGWGPARCALRPPRPYCLVQTLPATTAFTDQPSRIPPCLWATSGHARSSTSESPRRTTIGTTPTATPPRRASSRAT